MVNKIEVIFWDFDGVIIDSNSIREQGFEKCLSDFPKIQVSKLLDFHRLNGGLSRYVKFRYFFENIRKESISDYQILTLAKRFSDLMKVQICNKSLLIKESIDFIKLNYMKYKFHITSGSDQTELQYICDELNISKYFISIHGSPTPKIQLVKDLIEKYNYSKKNCLLIGDSINDFDASNQNGIYFKAFNSTQEVSLLSNCNFNY
jgi:phosphoglycolate phosphatase-like HAD superfamily hydrolase